MPPDADSCLCSVPCTRVTYEPALSYAQLSRVSINRLVLTDPARQEAVKKQYELSLETLQRTDSRIVATDERVLSDLQNKMETLSEVVSSTLLSQEFSELDTWITSLEESIAKDLEYFGERDKQVKDTVWTTEEQFEKYMGCVPDIIQFLEGFEFASDKRDVEQHLTECLDIDCDSAYESSPGAGGGMGGDDSGGPGGDDGAGGGGAGDGGARGGGCDSGRQRQYGW